MTSENKYIAIDIQIYPDNVNKLTKAKEEIEKYKEFIEEEEEKIIYWKIPFKNESISIRYDKDKDNKDILAHSNQLDINSESIERDIILPMNLKVNSQS